jgi:hypothetical protein
MLSNPPSDLLEAGYEIAKRLGLTRREFMSLVGLVLASSAAAQGPGSEPHPEHPDPHPGPGPDAGGPGPRPEQHNDGPPHETRGNSDNHDLFGNEPHTFGNAYKEYYYGDKNIWVDALRDDSSSSQSQSANASQSDRAGQKGLNDATRPGEVPSPVTGEASVFEKVHREYQRLFAHTTNEAGMHRLGEGFRKVGDSETKAYKDSGKKQKGMWAESAERGPVHAGTPKCTTYLGEASERAGVFPLYLKNGKYADTHYILAHPNSFTCWRPSGPAADRVIVFANPDGKTGHAGFSTDVNKGMAISAGSDYVHEYRHFMLDNKGVAHPMMHDKNGHETGVDKTHEVLFLENYCPDQEIEDHYHFDNWHRK